MRHDLSQKIHGNMIFSVYSIKMVFLFPTNMILPSFFFSGKKKALKDDISGIIEEVDIHRRQYCMEFLLIEKNKDDKKITFIKVTFLLVLSKT